MSTAMNSETTVPVITDDATERLPVNISTKQAKLSQSTSNSQKLCDLKVVLVKINVGECAPLPGGIGFSIQHLPAAVNLFSKDHIPVTWKSTKRKSKRSSDAISCCLGCTNRNTCKKAKASGKRKYVKRDKQKGRKRKKEKGKTSQARKGNQQSDPLHGARGTSFSGAHPGLYTDAVSTERPTYSSTLFLERGAVKQTLYTQVSANAVATDQIDLQVGSSDVASNHSESSGSVCVPGFPENNHQATVSDANTVHVVFSRVLATMSPHSSSVQAYPGVATQFIPNSPISPVPLANTAVPSLQQCHFPPSPATAADKAHPLIPSNFVNVPLQHPHAAAVPVYPPASFPLSLHQPVAVDVATGLPVYPIGQPFILPGDANSRQAVTSSFMPSSIGGPFIGRPAANSVPSSSASLLHQVQQSAETLRASEDSSILAAMSAGLLQPPESVSVNAAQEIDAACHQFGTVLEEVTKRNHLHGDYRFLVDYYRSVLEGGPTDAITRVTGVQTLKHFLKMAQGKLWAESYELRKSCLSLQSLTDKCQERIRQDGDRYKKVLNKKRNAEKNVGLVAKRLKEQKKRKLMGMGPDEVKELEAKLETLRNERDELQKKWLNHEQTRIQAPSEEEHP